ncbi:MAG: GrpB family protein [Pseudomonadota bacterium]
MTSAIAPYDPAWPERFAAAAAQLGPVFGPALIGLHHVGSTAVPGLDAKPEIDILAVVSDVAAMPAWERALGPQGYLRGGDLSDGHAYFRRNVAGVRTHKLHLCRAGHWQVARMLAFRDVLRRHPEARGRYSAAKRAIAARPEGGIADYLAAKAPVIDALMAEFGA